MLVTQFTVLSVLISNTFSLVLHFHLLAARSIVLSVHMRLCLLPAILQTTPRLTMPVSAVNLVSDTLELNNTAYRNSVYNADYIVQSRPKRSVHQKPDIFPYGLDCIVNVYSRRLFPSVHSEAQRSPQTLYCRHSDREPVFRDSPVTF